MPATLPTTLTEPANSKQRPQPQRLRLAAVGCVAVGLVFGFLFAAIEAGFQIAKAVHVRTAVSQNSEAAWIVYDEDLVYRPRELPSPGPKGKNFRVVFLGDSLIGGTKEGSLVGRVGAAMNQDSVFVPSEWINTGVAGYTNYQELVYLKKYGLAWQPDLVGVVFSLNDVHKFLHNLKVVNGKLIPGTWFWDPTPEAAQTSRSWLLSLGRRSLFLRWFYGKTTLAGRAVQMYESRGYDFDYRPDYTTAWQDAKWSMIRDQMSEMVELGKAHQFRLFLVVVPFGEQYRQDYLARDSSYVLKPQRTLAALMSDLKIPYLDLYPYLNNDCFIADRSHLTGEGKRRTSEQIVKFLANEKLIPLRSHGNQPR